MDIPMEIREVPKEPKPEDFKDGEVPILARIQYDFDKQRHQWNKTLLELYSKLDKVKNLGEIQVLMLSYSQILTDEVAFLNKHLQNRREAYRNQKASNLERMDARKANKSSNYGEWQEKNVYLESSLSSEQKKIDMLKNQIEFFNSTKETLKQLGYSLKYRISLYEMGFE